VHQQLNTKKMKKIIICISLFTLGCQSENTRKEWNDKDGLVPDSVTAIKIAEIIWVNIYGNSVLETKPYKTTLRKDNIWIVEGTLNNKDGGTPYIEIQKDSCKILKVIHTK
jgi:hypothetical protein